MSRLATSRARAYVPVFIHIDGTRLKHKPDMQTTAS